MQEATKEQATKNIPVGASVHAKLQAQARKEDRTIRVIAERLINEGLEREAAHAGLLDRMIAVGEKERQQ